MDGLTSVVDLFGQGFELYQRRRLTVFVKQLAASPRTDGYDQLPLWSDEQRSR